MKVYQPVNHVQGNRMMDPGHNEYGPIFASRYLTEKWIQQQGQHWQSYSIKTYTVIERSDQWQS